MPRYRCHKEVRAAKIARIEQVGVFSKLHFEDERIPAVAVTNMWIENKEAVAGGYYVAYDDGYSSFSPAGVFENGYTIIVQ